MGDQSIARPLHTHRIRIQTSTLRVGFKAMTPVFERAKTVHALDRTVTTIDIIADYKLRGP
jgi:hypothetical protein